MGTGSECMCAHERAALAVLDRSSSNFCSTASAAINENDEGRFRYCSLRVSLEKLLWDLLSLEIPQSAGIHKIIRQR